nr:tetratricopeptide repeat protein [Marinibactrum halimedae]
MTEEEQIEAFKRWWNENGKTTIAGVVLAVGAYFGWDMYNASQQAKAEAGSEIFQDLMEAVATEPGTELTDEKITTAKHLAGQLKESHKDSYYGESAGLMLAKLAVDANDLDTAVTELKGVLESNPSEVIQAVAEPRLARVLAAQGQFDEALALVQTPKAEALTSTYAEIRGDILRAKGEGDAARTAYQLALDTLPSDQSSRRNFLTMKLDDHAVASTNAVSTTEAQ